MTGESAAGGLAAGVDLGGTKIAVGVFESGGGLQGDLVVVPTRADGPSQGTLDALYSALDGALTSAGVEAARLSGIGIGTTGPLDPRGGRLLEAASLPNLFYCPLGRLVEERYGVETTMTNDGNCFALAEALYGAGRGEAIVLGVTLGTGCGVGVVIAGRILEGASANTGEVYRALIGDQNFDEALSGPGLERAYEELAGRSVAAAEVSRLADGGEPVALEAYRRFGAVVARGLGVFAAVLDPGVIVLGGSVSGGLRHFETTLREEIKRYLAPSAAERLRIVPAALKKRAGATGAAALVFSGGRLA